MPLYEPEEDELAEYVTDTLAALETVKQPHLQEGKARCMRLIKEEYEAPLRCKFIDGDWQSPGRIMSEGAGFDLLQIMLPL